VTTQRVDADQLIKCWLSLDLDEWTRRVVRCHFDPQTGSPYWLKRAQTLSFDPRDITRYAQLAEFGPFPLPVLREIDPVDLVPLVVPRPLRGRIWESGGTTGDPCRVFYTESMATHRGTWRRWSLSECGFELGRRWLQATPTGPHVIGNLIRELPDFAALVYGIDMDPRWVKRLLRAGRLRDAEEYTDHLLEQMTHILRTQQVDYLVTTPALFAALVREFPEQVARLGGAWLSGTQISGQMYRNFLNALDGGRLGVTYGNTFGNAVGLAPENDGAILPYAANYPHVTLSVRQPEDWTRPAGPREFGRVMLTVLHDDLFLPNILERDQAMRYDLKDRWPCDGVANVRPLQNVQSAPEGIY
jgi:hypothetical protein